MLTLHYHPLASYCQKALIGLYERDVRFDKQLVDLADPDSRAALQRLWPIGKFPVLHDPATGLVVPESTIILEHIGLIPADPEAARAARLWDRVFDSYVHGPMQKIVLDRLRPSEARDAHGVAEAHAQLDLAYAYLEGHLGAPWAIGDTFTLADCAAAPALYYADAVHPLTTPRLIAYFERLSARPSYARVRREAEPYLHAFPRS